MAAYRTHKPYTDESMKQYSVAFTEEERRRLGEIAAKQGLNFSSLVRSTMIRTTIDPWMENPWKPLAD